MEDKLEFFGKIEKDSKPALYIFFYDGILSDKEHNHLKEGFGKAIKEFSPESKGVILEGDFKPVMISGDCGTFDKLLDKLETINKSINRLATAINV